MTNARDRGLVDSGMVCEAVELGRLLKEMDHLLWHYFGSNNKNPEFGLGRMMACTNKIKRVLISMEYLARQNGETK